MEKIKNELKTELTQISYDTWFSPLTIRSINGNHIIFTTPSEFQRDFVENKYKPLLLNTLKFITNRDWEYSVVDLETEAKEKLLEMPEEPKESGQEVADSNLPKSGIDPKFTFDNFVVGKNNELAYAAALAVAQEPAIAYNPLFLYGGAGLRKNTFNVCHW